MSIVIEKVNKSYGTEQALSEISFSVKKGEVVGFLGYVGGGLIVLAVAYGESG